MSWQGCALVVGGWFLLAIILGPFAGKLMRYRSGRGWHDRD